MKIQFQNENVIIFESAIYRTTTCLIKDDKHLFLVDPNLLPIEINFIKNVFDAERSSKECVLAFTHSDYDHIIGYGKFKEYKTLASKAFVDTDDKINQLDAIRKFDDQYYVGRDYTVEYPSIKLIIDGEEERVIGNDLYQFYPAPGHTSDGILIFNKTKGVLVVGDYLSNIEFPFVYDEFQHYLSTLQTLEKIIETEEVNLLVVGHGDATVSKAEMINRIQDSRAYLLNLQDSILHNNPFDLNSLLSKYHFPKGLIKSHEENVKLLRKEFENRK